MRKQSTGSCSTGSYSTGNYSTGSYSTGDCSTGDCSVGNCSTGNCSTGGYSKGIYSTGNGSTGDRSTGDSSTGNYSTGNFSTGNFSTGNWSISKFSTGHFSTIDYSGFGAFDKPCTVTEWNKAIKPDFLNKIGATKWVKEKEMTEEEKRNNPEYKITGGFLKKIDMKEAWALAWKKATKDDKELLYKLPNFDKHVFKKISGIDVDEKVEEMTLEQVCKELGKTVKIIK